MSEEHFGGNGWWVAYSKGDIIKHDVELGGSEREILSDQSGDVLTLGDKLGGVELGDNTLQDLVHNRWEDSLVVVGTEGSVDLWEGLDSWSGQDTAGNVDHLEILGSGKGGDVAWLRADIVIYWCLKPWDLNVCTYEAMN